MIRTISEKLKHSIPLIKIYIKENLYSLVPVQVKQLNQQLIVVVNKTYNIVKTNIKTSSLAISLFIIAIFIFIFKFIRKSKEVTLEKIYSKTYELEKEIAILKEQNNTLLSQLDSLEMDKVLQKTNLESIIGYMEAKLKNVENDKEKLEKEKHILEKDNQEKNKALLEKTFENENMKKNINKELEAKNKVISSLEFKLYIMSKKK